MDACKYFLSGFVSYVAARKVEKKYVVLGQVSDSITYLTIQAIFTVVYCNIFCLHVQVRHSQRANEHY